MPKYFVLLELRERSSTTLPIICDNNGFKIGVATLDPKTGRYAFKMPLEKWNSRSGNGFVRDTFCVGTGPRRVPPISIGFCVEEDEPIDANNAENASNAINDTGVDAPLDNVETANPVGAATSPEDFGKKLESLKHTVSLLSPLGDGVLPVGENVAPIDPAEKKETVPPVQDVPVKTVEDETPEQSPSTLGESVEAEKKLPAPKAPVKKAVANAEAEVSVSKVQAKKPETKAESAKKEEAEPPKKPRGRPKKF